MATSRPRFVGVVLLLSVLAGACSSGGGGDSHIATLSGSNGTTTVPSRASGNRTAAKQAMQDAMLAFARCMRQHGVHMADPTFTSDGKGAGLALNGSPGSEATMNAAQRACQPIMDKAEQNMPKPSAAEQAQERDRMLAFTKCMREHGVNMPDPTFDANGGAKIQVHRSAPSGSGPSSNSSGGGPPKDPKFQTASKACEREGHGGPQFSLNSSAGK
ncbi:MAG: hypothetical protein JWL83_3801 [Actinomycetia bacterium]|nr:hypothetical protein [Actinomycetes bacterium]